LSAVAVIQRVEDISCDVLNQPKSHNEFTQEAKQFERYCLALDKSVIQAILRS